MDFVIFNALISLITDFVGPCSKTPQQMLPVQSQQ